MHKLIELIKSDNTKLSKIIGSFVYQAFKIRSELLYVRYEMS